MNASEQLSDCINRACRNAALEPDAQLYFRLHGAFAGADAIPCFCAEHAQSTLSGAGPDERCPVCDGDGCNACVGSGRAANELTTRRGYSCYRSAERLIERFGDLDKEKNVVIFSGEEVGLGFDGEPLVVPDGRVEVWTSLAELQKSIAAETN